MQKNNNGMWLPLIASVGVGAATYYTMTKHDQGIGQTMEKMIPFVSQMGGGGSTTAGMNMSGSNTSMGGSTGDSSSMNNNSGSSNGSSQNSQKLGPYGMS